MAQPVPHINRVGTAVPDHDVHDLFVEWAKARIEDQRERALFARMAKRAGIEHRWSLLPRAADGTTAFHDGGFYASEPLPSTAARMVRYAETVPGLAVDAVAQLGPLGQISHLVVASCTGFVAPGIDQIVAAALGLGAHVERTLVGFMGCYAAVAALRVAHHIVRSEADARVLVIAVEASTLHLQSDRAIEPLLSQMLFGDGAGAALVTAEPEGFAIDALFATTLPDSHDLIRWTIGDEGFAMHLSGDVPARIGQALGDADFRERLTGGQSAEAIDAWAVHAGGRSVLDAVEHALALPPHALVASREVLRRYGNMSSATLLFVLAAMLDDPAAQNGVAVAFGPGLAAEGFRFSRAG